MREARAAVLMGLLVAGCATSGPADSSGAARTATAAPLSARTILYGGGDGSSCEEAVVLHAHSEFAGGRAEYAWMADKYPGHRRGLQWLIRCNDKPTDRIQFWTADGRELDVFFDVSEYFTRF